MRALPGGDDAPRAAPRLIKRPSTPPAVLARRSFDSTIFVGDLFEILSYILSLKQAGTVHVHLASGGGVGSVEWETNHQRGI